MAAQQEPQAASGLVGVLDRIAKGLDGNPPLQAGIGGGILVVVLAGAVGGIGADQVWLFVVALVVLVLAGLGAWAVRRRAHGFRDRASLKVGRDATIGGQAEVLETRGEGSADVKKKISVGGNLNVSGSGKLGGTTIGGAAEPQPETPPAGDTGS
jgi:hypothetical protein